MAVEVSGDHLEQILQGIRIPPRPALLDEADRELSRDDPDLRRLAAIIARDVGLSAAVLKALNSPVFALRNKVANIGQAVILLGMRNLHSLVTAMALRNAMQGATAGLERFWDSAEKVASINAFICGRLPRVPREQAYALGLFRDCGIPLLMQRFADYPETLRAAAAQDHPLPEFEQVRHGTSHTAVGKFVGQTWGLPDTVCQAIQLHHKIDVIYRDGGPDNAVKALVGINFLAEKLIEASVSLRPDPVWESHGGAVLDFLGLSDEHYYEIEDQAVSLFG